MINLRKVFAAVLAGLLTAAPIIGEAAPRLAPPPVAGDVLNVRMVCNFSGCFEVPPPPPPGYYPPPDWDRRPPPPPGYYPPPDWDRRPPPPPGYYPRPDWDRRPPPPPPSARAPREHVRWCMERYRSYDPRSNTFIGRDGREYRCRSPWY